MNVPALLRRLQLSEAVIAYHGGTYDGSPRFSSPVCYFATTHAMADSYVDKSDDPGAQVRAFHLDVKNPASEEVVLQAAQKLGLEVGYYTPASLFDQELFDPDEIQALISLLSQSGYDSALCTDIGYGVEVAELVYILWDPRLVHLPH